VLNRCLPASERRAAGGTEQSDKDAILETRYRGEDRCSETLVSRLAELPRHRSMWVCRIEESADDLMTVQGILNFSHQLVDASLTKRP
jgi:hypothetical protein